MPRDPSQPSGELLELLRANAPCTRRALAAGVITADGWLAPRPSAGSPRALLRSLRDNTRVTGLSLAGLSLDDETRAELRELLRVTTALTRLDLRAVDDIAALLDTLRERPRGPPLRALWLGDRRFSGAEAQAMVSLLRGPAGVALERLGLANAGLDPGDLEGILPALAEAPALTRLDLRACQLDAASTLLTPLTLLPGRLRALALTGNPLGDLGAQRVAEAVQHSEMIERLELGAAGLTANGASALATAARGHPSLRRLALDDNPIGDLGARLLADSLPRCAALERLGLRGCQLTVDGAAALIHALEPATSLTRLDLDPDLELPPPLRAAKLARLCRNANLQARRPPAAAAAELELLPPLDPRQLERPTRTPAQPTDEREGVALPAQLDADAVAACQRVLTTLAADPSLLRAPGLAPLRRALARLQRVDPNLSRSTKSLAREQARRARDRAARRATGIQRQRAAMRDGAIPIPRPAAPKTPRDLEDDFETDFNVDLEADLEDDLEDDHENRREPATLTRARRCYICKAAYRQLHFFYDCLCPPCAALNFEKRCARADLRGRVALVTGGRIKIGLQLGLALLRCGARVIVTTRFPRDAARRYAREPDFDALRERLHIHALDLRYAPMVERFAEHVTRNYPRLDLLINNAAQTVQKPAGFHAELAALERAPASALPPATRALVGAGFVDPRAAQASLPATAESLVSGLDARLFPTAERDEHGQPLDLRIRNSWRLRVHEVETLELLEVQLVNAIAPYLLIARLRGFMARAGGPADRFIVNVSAVEGQFQRVFKSEFHPHTNMAKAGLNMLTRTSAADLARQRIFMNSVDTGWVTNENPHPLSERMAEDGFSAPLDELDGAARVLDPVFTGITSGAPDFGRFFKDYAPAPW